MLFKTINLTCEGAYILINLSKLTAGKKLTSLEKAILSYFVTHIDTVQDMGVRAVTSATYTSPAFGYKII